MMLGDDNFGFDDEDFLPTASRFDRFVTAVAVVAVAVVVVFVGAVLAAFTVGAVIGVFR